MLNQHARLGREVGMDERQIAIVENGRVIEFEHGEMKLGERIPAVMCSWTARAWAMWTAR